MQKTARRVCRVGLPWLSNGNPKKTRSPIKHCWMEVILTNFVPLQAVVGCWHLSISITVYLSPPSDTLLKALEGARCLKAFGAVSHWTGHLGTKRGKSEGHPRPDDESPFAMVKHIFLEAYGHAPLFPQHTMPLLCENNLCQGEQAGKSEAI